MTLAPGARLGPYEITALLGAGGMGEVYRAIDTRLNRTVALKIIASDAVADPERRRRFLTEARAASALNHANIITIHDIGEADGVSFLVMEFVPGRSLRDVIAVGPLSIDRVVDYALHIATALDVAHAAGIVHRDIKPANVMVTDAGQIKVLDFGVSKAFGPVDPETVTTAATAAGSLVGTLGYMSPEQVQGRPIDGRSDIFSFGAVLFEMVTGRRAFTGGGSLSIVSSILADTPPEVTAFRADVPAGLSALVHDCLARDREARPSARQATRRLADLRDSLAPRAASAASLLRRPVVLVPVTIAILAVAIAGWTWSRGYMQVRWARTVAVPEIEQRLTRDDYDGAFRLAREALDVLPDDPYLQQLWLNVTFVATLESEPSGADVAVKGYMAKDASGFRSGARRSRTCACPTRTSASG
jgi:serine/threonine protein kinase